jgi:hypothetical protein
LFVQSGARAAVILFSVIDVDVRARLYSNTGVVDRHESCQTRSLTGVSLRSNMKMTHSPADAERVKAKCHMSDERASWTRTVERNEEDGNGTVCCIVNGRSDRSDRRRFPRKVRSHIEQVDEENRDWDKRWADDVVEI